MQAWPPVRPDREAIMFDWLRGRLARLDSVAGEFGRLVADPTDQAEDEMIRQGFAAGFQDRRLGRPWQPSPPNSVRMLRRRGWLTGYRRGWAEAERSPSGQPPGGTGLDSATATDRVGAEPPAHES
jgi:hypothetical protein